MTLAEPVSVTRSERFRPRRYAMTRPELLHRRVRDQPLDGYVGPGGHRARAVAQWERLADVYRSLGHTVDEVPSVAGLPDMVYAANGATVVDGIVYAARFTVPAAGRRGRGVYGVAGAARLRPGAAGDLNQRG